ncbi:DUF1127 domain-containing protein [Roseomonas terrae]|uniref:DUF1127 domain-containing protein n=1 Tax=Neoroseomonas terrae TaxID=424799 RepID=A0ABS5EE55_9PROT|nr:DUF1127 domain-containing protein [Neoroseomonas terrae]MBR0649305.1 DUF1127 domain-containing protein [Neoroseomonas terrae]
MTTHSETWMTVRQPRARAGLPAFVALLARALERRAQRAALAALEPRLLRDIGVTPDDAAQEAGKPFWRH